MQTRVIATGLLIGTDALVNFSFQPDKPFTGCRICGEVFQSELDRTNIAPDFATTLRKRWSQNHAKIHSPAEHYSLKLSGNWCTPEAAQKLATYGVVSLTDLVLSEEHIEAYEESPNRPRNDAQGPTIRENFALPDVSF